MANLPLQQKIYQCVSKIQKGSVLTYGQIAKQLGLKSPRIIGFYLHKNTNPEKIPCHRVVFFDGSLSKAYAFGGEKAQRNILISEGVLFNSVGKVLLTPRVERNVGKR